MTGKLIKYGIVYVLSLSILLAFALTGCDPSHTDEESPFPPPVHFDLDSIIKRGKIVLLTENSASTYYLYRGETKGFDFELVKAFAKHIGVKLEVRLLDDVNKMFELLNLGEGDLIASNLTITPERRQWVKFSQSLYQTRQVLVQRKYDRANKDSLFPLITDTLHLHQVPIWVHAYSSFHDRLTDLEANSRQRFTIHEAPGEINTDDLIRLTASGEISATITDENLAGIQAEDYPELDFSLALTAQQDIAWAIRNNAPQLLDAINDWMANEGVKRKIAKTYHKYFAVDALFNFRGPYVLPEISANQISIYDSIFKKVAPEIGWDWRLLAALVYQESRFNPHAESWSGAFGLMQLMPETALKFGCDTTQLEEQNIKAGVKYIQFLDRFWKDKIPNPDERLKFVLASYNIGPGHILDAKVIALSVGKNDSIWDGNVAECLLLKTQEKYYTMEGVKHGYCRATEPFQFVSKILAVFDHYQKTGIK